MEFAFHHGPTTTIAGHDPQQSSRDDSLQYMASHNRMVAFPDFCSEKDQQWVGTVVKEEDQGDYIADLAKPSDCDDQVALPFSPDAVSSETIQAFQPALGAAVTSPDEASTSRKKRTQFQENERRATENTRHIGACMRCHIQRIRVRSVQCLPSCNSSADSDHCSANQIPSVRLTRICPAKHASLFPKTGPRRQSTGCPVFASSSPPSHSSVLASWASRSGLTIRRLGMSSACLTLQD